MTSRRQSLLVALAVVPSFLLAAGCGSSSATLTSMVITPSPVRLAVGGAAQLTVTGTYSDGTRAPLTSGVTFTTSDAAVAAVNSSGTVTALRGGASTVTASASGVTATVTVTVSSGPPTLVSIALIGPESALRVGGTSQLTVTGTYSDGSTVNLTSGSTFASASSGIATVSATGLVTAVANGTTTITATNTASGLVATAPVTVSAAAPTLVSIAVVPSPMSLLVGATGQLTVTGTYSDTTTVNLTAGSTFASSNTGAATVSASGLVTGVASGNAVVTATHTASGKIASTTVNVSATAPTLVSIAVTPATKTLAPAATQQLTVTGTYSDTTTVNLTAGSTFVSSSTGAATVSASGLVTAVAVGSTTITATHTASGLTGTSTITVSAPTLVSIALTPNPLGLAIGATQQLTVTGTFSDSSTANVTSGSTFVSSVTGVATVSAGGLVTAVANGTTTITATHTATGLTATDVVTVAAANPGVVFVGGYSPGVTFVGFGGSTNSVTEDATEQRAGRNSLKFVVTGAAGYSGGSFVASAPRDLSSFNALTYWAKASANNNLNVTGIGNDAAGGEGYSAESLTIPLTATWTKYIIPIPAPSKYTAVTGLFHLAEGNKGYTIWLNDIQYEFLAASEVGAPTGATVNLPATATLAVGATSQIAYQPNTVSFALPVLPNAGKLTNVGFLYFNLASSAANIATVSTLGLVTGVAPGTANITAALGSIAVPGQMAVTVTGGGGPTAPTTLAPTPPARAAGDVVSLYTSSGIYTNIAVATWATPWGTPNTVADYPIGAVTVKKYVGMSFVGVDYASTDATTFTHFHVDIWTPDASKFGVKLVNGAGSPPSSEAIVGFNATTTPAISTGGWISLDIPLSSFTGMSFDRLNQLLWLDNGDVPPGAVEGGTFYIDNVYFWK